MQNVETKINGDILTITIDLSKRGGLSKSGKTLLIASTQGNTVLPYQKARVQLGLNCYTGAEGA